MGAAYCLLRADATVHSSALAWALTGNTARRDCCSAGERFNQIGLLPDVIDREWERASPSKCIGGQHSVHNSAQLVTTVLFHIAYIDSFRIFL